MKFGPVTNKRNKTTSKKFDDDVMSTNWDVIDIFPIYGHSGAIWKSVPGRIVCKTHILIKSNFLCYKSCKQN